MKSVNKVVSEIREITSTPHSTFGGVNAVSFSTQNFQHNWVINDNENYPSDYKIELDNIETAIEIIHQFSEKPKEQISKGLKSLSTYTEKPPFYLHYFKTLKNG